MKPKLSILAVQHDIDEINADLRHLLDQPLDTKNFMAVDELLHERDVKEAELMKLEAIE